MDTARLDELQSHSESLLVAKLAAEGREQEARALVEALAPVGAHSAGDRSSGVPRNRAAETQARALVGRLSRDRRALAVAVDALGERMRHVRLMPASSVLELLPPMAGEMARAIGKEADFTTEGAELEVDRKVLEAIKDPLLHLIRNALAKRRDEPQISVRVSMDGDGLRVCDTGSPVPAQVLAGLLRAAVASTTGLGIGLYQAARQAEASGYRLVLEKNEPGEVCFALLEEQRDYGSTPAVASRP